MINSKSYTYVIHNKGLSKSKGRDLFILYIIYITFILYIIKTQCIKYKTMYNFSILNYNFI